MTSTTTTNRTEAPLVSVIIATRDRPEMLRRALRRVLAQSYEGPIECVVVFDQTGADRSLELDEGLRRVRVLTNDRKPGLAGARNCGATSAKGTWLAFCDDDDEWLPAKLASQLAALAAKPEAHVATCGIYIQYGERTTIRVPDESKLTFEGFLTDRMTEVHPSTFVVDRAAFFGSIGMVDEELPGSYAEDYEWLLRASRATEIVSVPEPLARIWWHKKSFFSDRWAMISSALGHLLAEYPEFDDVPKGKARILGQRAFAEAAQGHRAGAIALARETLKLDRTEKRAMLALGIAGGPLSAETALKMAHRFGKGI